MKWSAKIYDSIYHGVYLANEKGIIYTKTKKELKEYCIKKFGEEYCNYCIDISKN